jgi:hypothetical protein
MSPNVKAFLQGFASIANVSGRAYKITISDKFTPDDAEAMRKDFEQVGEDLRVAARELREDVPEQLSFSFE